MLGNDLIVYNDEFQETIVKDSLLSQIGKKCVNKYFKMYLKNEHRNGSNLHLKTCLTFLEGGGGWRIFMHTVHLSMFFTNLDTSMCILFYFKSNTQLNVLSIA